MSKRLARRRSLLIAIPLLLAAQVLASDLTNATVLHSPTASLAELKAIDMLIDEEAKRVNIRWAPAVDAASASVIVCRQDQMQALLPTSLRTQWTNPPSPLPAEGFTIRTLSFGGRQVVVIAGNDSRGVLFGVGYLLRKLELSPGRAELVQPINITTAPQYPIRGHQIGYRFKNNTYDAWTLPMFEQHIRDLAVFGTNSIQLISPLSDDEPSSPLFPAPALPTLLGISRILDSYGLDCDLYYPELRKDYSDSATVEAELKNFDTLFRQIPRVDALYIPGGDPGHTEPKYLFPLVEKEAAILHRYHPDAKVWISAQGFNQAWYEEFYALLAAKPAWLTGIFFGPQSRDSFETQRARIPARYPLLFYPDIAHTMHAQFPVPDWDPSFALTEGREPINPRPVAETHLYQHFAPLHQGFITYSEGVNDDVNKFQWTRLGWSENASIDETLGDYSRYFIGPSLAAGFTEGLRSLETNWTGSAATNPKIAETLKEFQTLEGQASPGQRSNWRFESALYRAYYDAYVQQRRAQEQHREVEAMAALRLARRTGSAVALEAARASLQGHADPFTDDLRSHVFTLAGDLFRHVGLQLSVKRYGASGIERGANLDRIDVSLNDRAWLTGQFTSIAALPTEADRLKRIATLVDWEHPTPDTLYDDLGNPDREPHLVKGVGFDADPELFQTSINGIADQTPDDGWRMAWITYAERLYESPLELRYTDLDPSRHYRVRVTYAGEGYAVPIKLLANDLVLHPFLKRPSNPTTIEFPIPVGAVHNGRVDLKWIPESGAGGSGRGHQVAEVWLIPEPR